MSMINKKPYQAPALNVLGEVSELTRNPFDGEAEIQYREMQHEVAAKAVFKILS